MTVRSSTDTLPLMRDQRMGDAERRFRGTWYEAGARFAPLLEDTKKRAWSGTHYSQQLLGGDAHMTVPAGHILIDPDSEIGLKLLLELELPPTLALGGRRGTRLLYRLPAEIVLRQHIGVLTDLDVITSHFVAPGSVVGGIYYRVVADLPVAELPLDIAVGLQLLEPPVQRKVPTKFIVVDEMASVRTVAAENRRVKARAARGRSLRRAATRPSAQRDVRWQVWLAEERKHHRHQALWSLALSMQRYGLPYEQYEMLVLAAPVSSKLKNQSPRWLREQVWDKAGDWLARQPAVPAPTSGAGGSRWLRRWRTQTAQPAARRWLRHADTVLRRSVSDAAMRASLWKLCQLHAQASIDFGVYGALNRVDRSGACCYFLAFSLMRAEVGCGGDAIKRRIARLTDLGLLLAMDRVGLVKEQATYYQIMINNKRVLPAAPGSTPLSCPLTCVFAPEKQCSAEEVSVRRCWQQSPYAAAAAGSESRLPSMRPPPG